MLDKYVNSHVMDKVFDAILSLKNKEECYSFFKDLCTENELTALAQRFQVAALLLEGETYSGIRKKTGTSTVTISRVNRALSTSSNGYAMVMSRLENKEI